VARRSPHQKRGEAVTVGEAIQIAIEHLSSFESSHEEDDVFAAYDLLKRLYPLLKDSKERVQ
jgi:hypothetical protein